MEKKSKFDPQQALGDKITKFSRRELCAFGSKLCAQILEDAGPGNYRGGVYPENISRDDVIFVLSCRDLDKSNSDMYIIQ